MFVHRTLEIDSIQKSKKIGFYPKSLRLFLRILCVVDGSYMHVEGTSRVLPATSLAINYSD